MFTVIHSNLGCVVFYLHNKSCLQCLVLHRFMFFLIIMKQNIFTQNFQPKFSAKVLAEKIWLKILAEKF